MRPSRAADRPVLPLHRPRRSPKRRGHLFSLGDSSDVCEPAQQVDRFLYLTRRSVRAGVHRVPIHPDDLVFVQQLVLITPPRYIGLDNFERRSPTSQFWISRGLTPQVHPDHHPI